MEELLINNISEYALPHIWESISESWEALKIGQVLTYAEECPIIELTENVVGILATLLNDFTVTESKLTALVGQEKAKVLSEFSHRAIEQLETVANSKIKSNDMNFFESELNGYDYNRIFSDVVYIREQLLDITAWLRVILAMTEFVSN